MRSLLVGLWKEMRDQRAVLIAVLVALPVLVLGAAWAFGDQVPEQHFAPTALFVVPASLALFLFAVASEIFGSERRRGTLDFTRRLPNGLWRSFSAKLLAYVVGSALFLAWGWVVAWVACRVFGHRLAADQFVQFSLVHADPVPTMVVAGLLCFGLWVLVTSTWIPQGGAAVLGAGLLLGLLALPAYLRLKDSVWLLSQLAPRTPADVLGPLGLLAGASTLVLGASHLLGNRRLSSAWAPAWRGLALLLLMTGGAYAAGAPTLERVLSLDPREAGYRIQGGSIGADGRFAYLNVLRVGSERWADDDGLPQTPTQPWIVDLDTGGHVRAGEFIDCWSTESEAAFAPQPFVHLWSNSNVGVGWYDAATARLRTTLPYGVRSRAMNEWERRGLAALAWHEDAEGRALWFEGDRLVREGDPLPKEMSYMVRRAVNRDVIPGGWCEYAYQQGGHRDWVTVEAATGKVRSLFPAARHGGAIAYLSPRLALVQKKRDAKTRDLVALAVVDLDAAEAQPREVTVPPGVEWVGPPVQISMPAAGEASSPLLVMTGTQPDERRVARWSPLTGETTELTSQGRPIVGYAFSQVAHVPGGRKVLRVQRYPFTTDGSKPYRFDHYLLDTSTGVVQHLHVVDPRLRVLAILQDGAVVGIEAERYVVRYGPEIGARTVLFPR